MQCSLVLLKPDCVQRRLMGEIIGRFEAKGLNIIGMRMLKVSPELAKQHYAEHVSKPFYRLWRVSLRPLRSWRWPLKALKPFASCGKCLVPPTV